MDWKFSENRILKLGNDTINVKYGLPQGSLSPILFNIYSRGLHMIEDNNTKVYQFADDFTILSFHKDFDEFESQ